MAGMKGFGATGVGSSRLGTTNYLLAASGEKSFRLGPTEYLLAARDQGPSNTAVVLCGSTSLAPNVSPAAR